MSRNLCNCPNCQTDNCPAALPPVRSEQLFDAASLKEKISAILSSVLNGSAKHYRTEDGIYIRWGLVERDIHAAIDAANKDYTSG